MGSRMNYSKMSYWNYYKRHPSDRDDESNGYYFNDKDVQWRKKQTRSSKRKKVKNGNKISKSIENCKQISEKNRNQNVPILFVLDISQLTKDLKRNYLSKKEMSIRVHDKIKTCCDVVNPTFLFVDDKQMYIATSERIHKNGLYSVDDRIRIKEKDFENYHIFQISLLDQCIPFVIACSKNAELNKLAQELMNNPVDLRKKF